ASSRVGSASCSPAGSIHSAGFDREGRRRRVLGKITGRALIAPLTRERTASRKRTEGRSAMGRTRSVAAGIAAIVSIAGFHATETSAQVERGSPPLPELPTVVRSSDYSIRVVELAGGLSNPW